MSGAYKYAGPYKTQNTIGPSPEEPCQECQECVKWASGDWTTPGFFYSKCPKHRAEENGKIDGN